MQCQFKNCTHPVYRYNVCGEHLYKASALGSKYTEKEKLLYEEFVDKYTTLIKELISLKKELGKKGVDVIAIMRAYRYSLSVNSPDYKLLPDPLHKEFVRTSEQISAVLKEYKELIDRYLITNTAKYIESCIFSTT